MFSVNNQPENADQPALPEGQGSHTVPSQLANRLLSTRRPRRPRMWLAVLVTMLVALLFGVVVFAAGWEFGRGSLTPLTGIGF